MTTELMTQSWSDLARSVAWEFGLQITYDFADYLLWNETGFPGFFKGDPRIVCTEQLRSYFERQATRG